MIHRQANLEDTWTQIMPSVYSHMLLSPEYEIPLKTPFFLLTYGSHEISKLSRLRI